MIWYVSSKQGDDAHDGQSLATAFKSLARAARVSAARAANIVVAVAGG